MWYPFRIRHIVLESYLCLSRIAESGSGSHRKGGDMSGSSRMQEPWPLSEPPILGTALPPVMHALVINRDRYGPPSEALRFEQVPLPRLHPPDAGKVLVAILATGPNFNTNFASLGLPVPVFGRGDGATRHIPGSDALGIVVDAGPSV